MSFVRSVEEAGHEARLSKLVARLCAENSVPIEPSLSFWCHSQRLSDKWFAFNND